MTPVLASVYRSIDWPLFSAIQVATDKRPQQHAGVERTGFDPGCDRTTTYKGSDSLRALFLLRFPGEARGCAAGDEVPETPEMAYFWPGAVSVLRLPCG